MQNKSLFNSKPLELIVISSLLIVFLILTGTIAAQDHEWGYEGEEGPANWGALSEEYAQCAEGVAQSPIDIDEAISLDLVPIDFSYGETAMNIFNNGHTIQVNVDDGSSITYNGITYNLLQFHFHHPSEHTVAGEPAPMEIHFVHQDPHSGTLAVVGILLVEGDSNNEAYATVFDHLPTEESEPDAMGLSLTLADLLPEAQSFYTYQGSLTTPPCSEIVRWLLFDNPIELSAEQIETFATIYENNARPTQPLGNRDLLTNGAN